MRILVTLFLWVVTPSVVAAECVWQTPQEVVVGSTTLVFDQDTLQKASAERVIKDHLLVPHLDRLVLEIIDPHTTIWTAPLARIGTGRCTAYYVGPATPEAGRPE